MKRLNLEEIGRLAGVSRSTVSRVVNGEANVSADAKQRVEAVIAETGYRPHAAAKSLASSKTGVIGLIIPSAVSTLFDDPFFGRLILGISNATNALGRTLALFLFDDESDYDSIISRVVNPGLVDGVIVTATRMGDPVIDHLQKADMPFVVVGRADDGQSIYSVDVDNRGGARAAALYLAGLGHERIGMIAAPSTPPAGAARRAGFLEGMAEAGLDIDDRLAEGNWTEGSGRLAMDRLLAGELPDAVFVSSDRMAVGALRAIHEAGLRCPQDIAIVSFDGLISADQTMPRLTSMAQPVNELGERAARLLDSIIGGDGRTPEQVVFATELVVRESCGATIGSR